MRRLRSLPMRGFVWVPRTHSLAHYVAAKVRIINGCRFRDKQAPGNVLVLICRRENQLPVGRAWLVKGRETMARHALLTALALIAVLNCSCANPAANKPKASVSNAAPEGNSAKPAGAETLTISPDNSKVDFVAAKVTRSHNGSF